MSSHNEVGAVMVAKTPADVIRSSSVAALRPTVITERLWGCPTIAERASLILF